VTESPYGPPSDWQLPVVQASLACALEEVGSWSTMRDTDQWGEAEQDFQDTISNDSSSGSAACIRVIY
jgi:hypothetical protein